MIAPSWRRTDLRAWMIGKLTGRRRVSIPPSWWPAIIANIEQTTNEARVYRSSTRRRVAWAATLIAYLLLLAVLWRAVLGF